MKRTKKGYKYSRKRRKSSRKRVAGAPPELHLDKPMKEQIEYALSLLRESNLNELVMDVKPHSKIEVPLQLGMTSWSNLTYWNGYQILQDTKGHKDDMRNIIYMLKHEPKFKKQNKEDWIKHIKRAIFTENYGLKFDVQKYRAPPIKQPILKRISLKDLSILLLEHRLSILEWMEENPNSRAEVYDPKAAEVYDPKAAEVYDPKAAEEPSNPYVWNNSNETQLKKEKNDVKKEENDVKNNWNNEDEGPVELNPIGD